MSKTAQELCEERKKRVLDAAALKVPDRVPLYMPFGSFAARHSGISVHDIYADPAKYLYACEKMMLDYEPDFYLTPNSFDIAAHEMLGDRLFKWPGNGVGIDSPYQWVEGEYMRADEYDEFIKKTGDFVFGKYLPRGFSGLEGLKNLPPLMATMSHSGLFASFSNPAILDSLETLVKAMRHNLDYLMQVVTLGKKMEERGIPNILCFGAGQAPFDFLSDFLRGMKGLTFDMFRRPDKVLAATEAILPVIIGLTKDYYGMNPTPLGFGATHRGSDDFMSVAQFEKFYWPGFKQVIAADIELGLKPFMFFEGYWNQRLDHLNELPKGQVVGWFDRTDLLRAKKVIGNNMCICGGMPLSLLQTGTPQQVADYTKKLIDELAPGGGFIMGSITELDYAKPELLEIWVKTTKEYGVYK
jgi:uroporphyrinogen-III decarboxylase